MITTIVSIIIIEYRLAEVTSTNRNNNEHRTRKNSWIMANIILRGKVKAFNRSNRKQGEREDKRV